MTAIISKYVKLNKVNVIRIFRTDDGEVFTVLSASKKRDRIELKSSTVYANYDELERHIDVKLPVLLVVDGKGVLNKRIDFNNHDDIVWHRNIDNSAIFFTSYKTRDNNFMSFCRKKVITDYCDRFLKSGISIVDSYVGSFLAALLNKSLAEDVVLSGDINLHFEENELSGFDKRENPVANTYVIGDDSISSDALPMYGTLLHFYLQQDSVDKTDDGHAVAEELLYKKIFNFTGALMLGGFLACLLASYILTGYYMSKNLEMNLESIYFMKSRKMIVDLEKQKDVKVQILNETGFLTSKFLSFYAFELLGGIPKDISLNQIDVTPLAGEIREDKKVGFDVKTIMLMGENKSEISLNQWISSLKERNWVKKLEILSIKKDKKGVAHFELKLILKDV